MYPQNNNNFLKRELMEKDTIALPWHVTVDVQLKKRSGNGTREHTRLCVEAQRSGGCVAIAGSARESYQCHRSSAPRGLNLICAQFLA
jgi:hypothetical protein